MSNKEIYNPHFRKTVKQSYDKHQQKYWSDKVKGLSVRKFTLVDLAKEFSISYTQLVRLLYFKKKAKHEDCWIRVMEKENDN